MNKDELMSWKKGFEAANKAERVLVAQEEADYKRSVRLSLSLINAGRGRGIWDGEKKSCLREKEIEFVRRQWKRLKESAHR